MLKTTRNTGSAANLDEIEGKADGDSVFGNSMVNGSGATKSIKRKNQAQTTKSKILIKSKIMIFFQILGIRKPENVFLLLKLN